MVWLALLGLVRFSACGAWRAEDEDIRSKVNCHVQWCGLSRAHAYTLINFPDLERLYAVGDRMSDWW